MRRLQLPAWWAKATNIEDGFGVAALPTSPDTHGSPVFRARHSAADAAASSRSLQELYRDNDHYHKATQSTEVQTETEGDDSAQYDDDNDEDDCGYD